MLKSRNILCIHLKSNFDTLEIEEFEKMKQNIVIGNPKDIKNKLEQLQTQYKVDEIMIVTITHSPKDRIESYKLIADEVLLE